MEHRKTNCESSTLLRIMSQCTSVARPRLIQLEVLRSTARSPREVQGELPSSGALRNRKLHMVGTFLIINIQWPDSQWWGKWTSPWPQACKVARPTHRNRHKKLHKLFQCVARHKPQKLPVTVHNTITFSWYTSYPILTIAHWSQDNTSC